MGMYLMKQYSKWVSLRKCLDKVLWIVIALLEDIYGTNYKLEPKCLDCRYQLKLIDVLRGFRQDPQDFTTGCPECGLRFEMKNRATGRKDENGFQFMSDHIR